MKTIKVRRGFYERFGEVPQRVVSLSQGRGVLIVDPGTVAIVDADDMAEGNVYTQDLVTFSALTVHAGEAQWGEELTASDLRRIDRLVSNHLRRYRYAVECGQYGLSGGYGPDPSAPLATSLEAAREILADYGRETGTNHGWFTGEEWVSQSHAWVYASAAWDGISYGDPVGVMQFGPRGGVRFEYA